LEVKKIAGLRKVNDIIAIFKELDGYAIIYQNETSFNQALKITYLPNSPIFVDTLIKNFDSQFKSKRFPTTYSINDSQVISIHFQKIIHPSSNWQGQTPWQETIVAHYPRVDRCLR
jgi:hypothetical protein